MITQREDLVGFDLLELYIHVLIQTELGLPEPLIVEGGNA